MVSTGYREGATEGGIDLPRNKVEQNALRARVELDRRTSRSIRRQAILVAASTITAGVVGALLALWL